MPIDDAPQASAGAIAPVCRRLDCAEPAATDDEIPPGFSDDAFRCLELARIETRDRPNARRLFDNIERYLADAPERGQAADLFIYLGLPNTPARIMRWRRDRWLVRVAELLAAPELGAWTGCQRMSTEWGRFLELGVWLESKHCKEPPAELGSKLRKTIWWASHFDTRALSRDQPLSAKTLSEIDAVAAVFRDRNRGDEARSFKPVQQTRD